MAKFASIARPADGTLVARWDEDPHGTLQMTGAEEPLAKEEQDLLDGVHRFAAEVMRPIGERLDRMTPEEVIAAVSRLWQVVTEFAKLGIGVDQLLAFEPAQGARAACLMLEELGWGDAGLASSLGVSMFPRWMAAAFGNQHLLKLTPGSKLGCWATTGPGHGSDQLDPGRQIFHPGGEYGQPDCVATLSEDRVVINGRKADWISNGTIAEVCILHCAADTGHGPDPERGCVVIVPMDAPGVSRGAPLDKLGQRALNQGAVIFDNVVLPVSNVLAGPDDYQRAAYQVLVLGNSCMGDIFVGTARAAYAMALVYSRERRPGGAGRRQRRADRQDGRAAPPAGGNRVHRGRADRGDGRPRAARGRRHPRRGPGRAGRRAGRRALRRDRRVRQQRLGDQPVRHRGAGDQALRPHAVDQHPRHVRG